jgi:hypothetical protein
MLADPFIERSRNLCFTRRKFRLTENVAKKIGEARIRLVVCLSKALLGDKKIRARKNAGDGSYFLVR